MAKHALRWIALVYVTFLVAAARSGWSTYRTFENGLAPVIDALTSEQALHAFKVTAIVSIIAVVCNTIFGVTTAILLVRHNFPGRRLLNAAVDLPIAVSPIVVGLALILVYGKFEPIGGWFQRHGIGIIYSLPGMVLATIFVSLPFVVRSVAPVLEEIGTDQEQAATDPRRHRLPDVPPDHPAGDPLGRRLRRRAEPGPVHRRVRCRGRRLRPHRRARPRPRPCSCRNDSRTTTRRPPTPPPSPWR